MWPHLLVSAALAASPRTATDSDQVKLHEFAGCYAFYDPLELKPERVEATSSLTEGSITHGPERAFDGDPATAWVEGVPGDGVGEALLVWLPERAPEGARYDYARLPDVIGVLPGYARDSRRWTTNRRVRVLELRWLAPKTEGATASSRDELRVIDRNTLRLELTHTDGVVPERQWQYVEVGDVWNQDMESTDVVAVELAVTEVDAAGATYEDTCISEVRLLVARASTEQRRCTRGWCASQADPAAIEACADPL